MDTITLSANADYPSTLSSWPEEGAIQIYGVDGIRIAIFSVSFLRKGGILDWDYILFATHAVVRENGKIFSIAEDKTATTLLSPPTAGYYKYIRQDAPEIPPAFWPGPRFQYKSRGPPPPGHHSDTMSHSSRRSTNQDSFRFQLAIRDGFCLVTNSKKAVASHILPVSRPEYYTEVLGYDPGYLYDVSYGLFLSRDLHHAFDRGEWSLYPKPGDPDTLQIHVFYSEDPADDLKSYHGKEIKQDRFRFHSLQELPHRGLLAFHYRQCVIKHVRLFSHFPN